MLVSSDECYFVGTTEMDWYRAKADCVSRSGDLVTITDEFHHQTLESIINTYANKYKEFIWIGLTRKTYTWSTGTYIPKLSKALCQSGSTPHAPVENRLNS